MPYFLQNRFARGELSDRISEVAGTEVYEQGCPVLREAVITKQGTVKKRGGLVHVAACQADESNRLFRFRTRNHGEFILEFFFVAGTPDQSKVYAYKDGVGDAVIVASLPYSEAELQELRFQQIDEDLIIVHKDWHPCVLRLDYKWNGASYDYSWTFGIFDTLGTGPELRPLKKTYPLSLNKLEASQRPFLLAGNDETDPDAFKASDWTTDNVGGIWRLSGDTWVRLDNPSANWRNPVVTSSKAFIEPLGITNSGTTLANILRQTADGKGIEDEWVGPWLPESDTTTANWTYTGTPGVGDIFTAQNAAAGDTTQADNGAIVDFDTGSPGTKLAVILYTEAGSTQCTLQMLHGTMGASPNTSEWRLWRLRDRATPARGVSLQATATSGTGISVCASALPGGSIMPNVFGPSLVANGTYKPAGRIYMNGGIYEVTAWDTEYEVTCTAVEGYEPSSSAPTTCWSLGWSEESGYPRAVGYHQRRLVFGGVPTEPNRLFLSKTNQIRNFEVGTLDADAMNIAIGAETGGGGVQWLHSQGDLIVGTEDAEYAVRGQPLSPSDLGVDVQSTWGSSDIQPINVGNSILFVTKDRKRVRQIAFEFDRDRYVSTDMTFAAEHLFEDSTIREIAYMRDPDSLIMVVLDDGTLLSCSYYPEDGVMGWSKCNVSYTYGDQVRSMAVRRQEGSGVDELWCITERGTADTRYIEKFDNTSVLDFYQAFSATTINLPTGFGSRYVDIIDSSGDYIERMQLDEDGDGTPSIASGFFGFPVNFRMTPQITQYRDRMGSTSGRKRHVTGMLIRLHESEGGTVNSFPIKPTALGKTKELTSAWYEVPGLGVAGIDARPLPEIVHDEPVEFEVLAVNTMTTEVGR